MTAVSVNENALVHLSVGDFVAILTHHMKNDKLHWILGSVETPPYLRDVEIRLWAKQRFELDEGDTPTNPETAALMDRIAQVKDELQKSIDQAEDLTEQLRDRRAAIIQKIAEANRYVAESNAVCDAARDDVENISDRNWQELKSYRIPPKMVSVIIRAVMLLLSEDEARTWPHMQRVLRDFYFKRRITSYDPSTQLSPERRDYILQECVSKKSFRYDRAMQGSVAMGPIYYWVLAQLDSGEAQSQREDVEQEKVARQKELRGVLEQISQQQERISEYQELMDDLDDQLRLCSQRNGDGSTVVTLSRSRSASRSRSRSRSRPRRRISISDHYAESFAAREGKEYLRPAFYTWRPTDRVIIVLRKNIVCNFGAVTSQEQEEGYNMSEPQIRMLDEGLMRSRRALERICGDEDEDHALEADMLKQNDDEAYNTVRNDEDILEERQRNAAEEKLTPTPPLEESDTTKVGIGAAEATSKLQRTFEGKNWHRILDCKREAIEAAFREDSSECLKVPPYSISIESLIVGSLIVDFSAQHDGQRSDAELQECVKAFGFPKVMSLYEEEDEEDAEDVVDEDSPEHQMRFGGDHWGDIAPEHHGEIEAAFLADTSAATGALQDEIVVHDIRTDADEGLTVDYSMLDKDRDPEEVQEQVDAYAYPSMWTLYQRLAGLDEAVPIHQVRFRGERWADIMPGAEEAIKQAFAEDTAGALGIAPQQVIPDEIRYEKGLTVPYTVLDCSLDGDEVDAKAEDYHYPNTWALYDRLVAEAVGAAYQKSFEGEHWEAVLHAARPEVSEAFCTDTANAVKSEPGDVDLRSVDTDQNRLLVSYNVGDSQQRVDEVRADTQEYPYPEVWALYQLVIAEEAEGTRKLSQTFDGESWDAINAEMPEQVRGAFTEDVIVATRVDSTCVMIRDIKTSKRGMTVEYGIVREEGQSAYATRKAARNFDYPVTWGLYEANKKSAPAQAFSGFGEGESAIFERRFEGDDWDIVLEDYPEELSDAFRSEAARVLCVPKQSVRIISTEIGSPNVKYQIVGPPCEDREIERRMEEDELPEVMDLYHRCTHSEDGGATLELLNLEEMPPKVFDGDEWDFVMANQRVELEQAFVKDTADALGVSDEQVTVKEMKVGPYALQVQYSVRDCPSDEAAAQATVEDYPYPYMWEMYPEEEDLGKYQKTFDGTGWKEIVASREDSVRAAFAKDAANALEVDEESVVVKSVRANAEGLEVRYNVTSEAWDREQIMEMQEECDYPNTWALYEGDEGNWVTTSHQIGFDGEDWVYVVQDKMPELHEAFVSCTAELFHVRPEHVTNTEYTLGSLIVDFELTHPTRLSEEEIKKQLVTCPYEPVWELYGYHPWVPTEVMGTTHNICFEGPGWATVLESQREELEERFKQGTAVALEVEPSDVRIDSADCAEECLFIRTTITHHIFQDNELLQEQLTRYPYEEVWKLYVEDPNQSWAVTSHQVGFDGDDWVYIVSANKAALKKTFRTCTGESLDLADEHITNIVFEANEAALLTTFEVKHPREQSVKEVNRRLAECDYMPVWELYIDHPYNPEENEVTSHEIGFEGDEWNKVIKTQPKQLEEAIMLDTSEALEVTPNDITSITTSFENGNLLIVRLNIQHPVLQDEELIKEQLSRYPYERVWALYEDAPITPLSEEDAARLNGTGEGESAIFERRFEGDDWDIVLEDYPEELSDAFRSEAARVLCVPKQSVRIISTEIGSLIVKYQIVGPPCEDREIERRMEEDELPEVLNLYRRRCTRIRDDIATETSPVKPEEEEEITTLEDCGFEGADWDYVWSIKQEAVCKAFAKGVADALGIKPTDIQNINMEKSADGIVLGANVTHPLTQDHQMICQTLKNHPFEELWALYETRPYNPAESVTTEHIIYFEGEEWDAVMAGKREEVVEAIRKDTASALNLPADDVVSVCTAVEPTGLLATVVVSHSPLHDDELIQEELIKYEYERVWVLYCPESGPLHGTKHFDGLNWANVIASARTGVMQAFREDTAAAVNIRPDDVDVGEIRTTGMGMDVDYTVNLANTSGVDIEHTLLTYPYPNLWGHYRAEEITTLEDCGFEGADWDYVWSIKQEAVCKAFAKGVADALGIKPTDIQNINMEKSADGIVLGANVTHPLTQDHQMICQTLKNHPFEELWALYETRPYNPAESVTTDHIIYFEGEEWDAVMAGKREEVVEAIRKDTASALNLPADDVVSVCTAVEPTGLLATVVVSHSPLHDDELIQEELIKYEYERVWVLYCPESGPLHGTKHFDGLNWANVIASARTGVMQAFREDTAAAVNIRPDDVDVGEIRTTGMGMDVDYTVNLANTSGVDIEHTLLTYPYPNLWGHYRAEEITTLEDCGFEGADWDYVWSIKQEAVCKAFAKGVADALGIKPTDIQNINMEKSADGIVLGANVTHPLTQDHQMICQTLKNHPFEELWALYETRPHDQSDLKGALSGTGDRESGPLQRLFDGDDWDLVVEGCPEDAKDAFRKGVADSVHVPKSGVVVMDWSLGSLIVSYKVCNCDMEDDEIDKRVYAHDFPELMALYRARVRGGENSDCVATEGRAMCEKEVVTVDIMDEGELPEGYMRVGLSVSFEGELWEKIVKRRTQELADAFRADTAKSIGAALGDIHVRECVVSKALLLVHFSAGYEATVTEAELRKKVDEYSYGSVWALYDEMEDALEADMSEVMVKRFVGVHWDVAIETCPTLVKEAFKEDTANALRTHASKVIVEDIALGSLIVRFRVHGLTMSEAKAMQMTDNYAYPNVWALYMCCEEANGRASLKNRKNGSGGRLSHRPTEQLVAEEGVESQDTVTYLRKALADARRERDMYMEQVEQAQRASQNV
ncbi:putative mitotubule-associated protein Gb4 [Leishmania mexicana MHOM/GT/2001/U1103]|uniref:Mitotubule-associated protein Gb4 n=1 Tax=Leishmania mexicana (strain MHOM/GT/2001/U1103) TaxID=929439 RepID=E9AYH5_LEIMU|nr:putative mitotubule-associated protein Gb4 [Leishmania mexicana MHOM/GT/2001/U1103]CBZ28017.1 putative mitotubule-associated protein Gb4 [Leishmania mexicana MHOM/GT/2001/U1103]